MFQAIEQGYALVWPIGELGLSADEAWLERFLASSSSQVQINSFGHAL